MAARIGTVVAVCTSAKPGVPKYPQLQVEVGTDGLMGDFHNRRIRPSFSEPGRLKSNDDRHISIVAAEVLQALNGELKTKLVPGSFGENLLVRWLGDLADIADGARLRVNGGVILVVTQQNQPCNNLAGYHRLMVKSCHGRRGLLCAIEQGAGKFIQPGDAIEVL